MTIAIGVLALAVGYLSRDRTPTDPFTDRLAKVQEPTDPGIVVIAYGRGSRPHDFGGYIKEINPPYEHLAGRAVYFRPITECTNVFKLRSRVAGESMIRDNQIFLQTYYYGTTYVGSLD